MGRVTNLHGNLRGRRIAHAPAIRADRGHSASGAGQRCFAATGQIAGPRAPIRRAVRGEDQRAAVGRDGGPEVAGRRVGHALETGGTLRPRQRQAIHIRALVLVRIVDRAIVRPPRHRRLPVRTHARREATGRPVTVRPSDDSAIAHRLDTSPVVAEKRISPFIHAAGPVFDDSPACSNAATVDIAVAAPLCTLTSHQSLIAAAPRPRVAATARNAPSGDHSGATQSRTSNSRTSRRRGDAPPSSTIQTSVDAPRPPVT